MFWGDCGVLFFVAFCRVWGVGCAVSGIGVWVVCVCWVVATGLLVGILVMTGVRVSAILIPNVSRMRCVSSLIISCMKCAIIQPLRVL